jgi:hypothetical protein
MWRTGGEGEAKRLPEREREIPLIWSESRYNLDMLGCITGMECPSVSRPHNTYRTLYNAGQHKHPFTIQRRASPFAGLAPSPTVLTYRGLPPEFLSYTSSNDASNLMSIAISHENHAQIVNPKHSSILSIIHFTYQHHIIISIVDSRIGGGEERV